MRSTTVEWCLVCVSEPHCLLFSGQASRDIFCWWEKAWNHHFLEQYFLYVIIWYPLWLFHPGYFSLSDDTWFPWKWDSSHKLSNDISGYIRLPVRTQSPYQVALGPFSHQMLHLVQGSLRPLSLCSSFNFSSSPTPTPRSFRSELWWCSVLVCVSLGSLASAALAPSLQVSYQILHMVPKINLWTTPGLGQQGSVELRSYPEELHLQFSFSTPISHSSKHMTATRPVK